MQRHLITARLNGSRFSKEHFDIGQRLWRLSYPIFFPPREQRGWLLPRHNEVIPTRFHKKLLRNWITIFLSCFCCNNRLKQSSVCSAVLSVCQLRHSTGWKWITKAATMIKKQGHHRSASYLAPTLIAANVNSFLQWFFFKALSVGFRCTTSHARRPSWNEPKANLQGPKETVILETWGALCIHFIVASARCRITQSLGRV